MADRFPADRVRETLERHMLLDGFPLVLDLRASHGTTLVDEQTGTGYLDMFTFFASNALGMNHPGLTEDEEFRAELLEAALNKVSNSDIYTVALARFVDTFARVMGADELPRYFFIEGGAPAVENALKTAFDWKSRLNEAEGRSRDLGGRIMHLTDAFHGRTGYTMTLTNTDPNKTDRYPKLPGWPRITSPYWASERDMDVVEADTLEQAEAAFEEHPHDIAAFIMEPIQGEGGDHAFRPQFLAAMKELVHHYDALFIFDEVQTGGGMTGTPWAWQQLGTTPDIMAFGKKLQVCGITAGGRVEEVRDNVFRVPSRINSTWGGNLADMVRARRIMEIIERDDLLENARTQGAYLLERLRDLALRHRFASNPRGLGLMCALSLPDTAARDEVLRRLRDDERVLMLGSGRRTIRFRPALTVTREELDRAVDATDRVLTALEG
ncbi:L-lysine 6-transaminase [Propioniciclava coleopterorum]|uniref:L-lysine-epsilon aminotransferase n=1 Tax=Propioniciclava coleopterorum TaxID=2714937 RepID=A0A6G7Y5K6_9ACTN|nr:L-lysine 6-transaminase [Propioniciclava coleopterorum]QIK71956.1 L-lysine 6-transaminase [Propioniciclava coleopterorum]